MSIAKAIKFFCNGEDVKQQQKIDQLCALVNAQQEKLNSITKTVWKFTYPEPGVNFAVWSGEQDAPHGPIVDIFNQPGGPFGVGDHINGSPTHVGVTPDFNLNDIELIGNPEAQAKQQWAVWGYKEIPEDGFIRDNNANTGETAELYCGISDGCCNSQMELLSEQVTNTSAADRTVLDPTPVKAGIYPAVLLMSDLSFYGGLDLEFSTDGESWSNLTGGYPSAPMWVARQEPCDYVLEEGESLNGPSPCCPSANYFPVVGEEGGPAEFEPLYPEAGRKLANDNFQDGNGNAPFNFQVRNQTNTNVNWQACTPPVPYATIPALNTQGANYTVVNNGDGTYLHCFDGTLGPFASIIITGAVPNPPGVGGTISMYCETA